MKSTYITKPPFKGWSIGLNYRAQRYDSNEMPDCTTGKNWLFEAHRTGERLSFESIGDLIWTLILLNSVFDDEFVCSKFGFWPNIISKIPFWTYVNSLSDRKVEVSGRTFRFFQKDVQFWQKSQSIFKTYHSSIYFDWLVSIDPPSFFWNIGSGNLFLFQPQPFRW